MLRYKNMVLAYSFEIIWALIWIMMTFILGYKAIAFFALGALRPVVLEKIPFKAEDIPWYEYYIISRYAAVITCCIIILFYVIDVLFLPENFLIINRYKIIGLIIPLFIFLHGLMGFLYQYNNRDTI